jgi:PIN domain nuclease of toxin-antitoxin system
MKVLLDTHTFLWWITDDPQLSPLARDLMSDGRNSLFLSAASGWEMAIKAGLGRLSLPEDVESFMRDQLTENAIGMLPITMRHALHVYRLPPHHRDPFDRMLVAQSQLENLPLITRDSQLASYAIDVIW